MNAQFTTPLIHCCFDRPPEKFQQDEKGGRTTYTSASDVWSYGIILHQLVTQNIEAPWTEMDLKDIIEQVN